MTAIELKNMLIHQISSINDITFLKAIKTIIDTKSEKTVYMTTPEQKNQIKEGQDQIQRGEYITNGGIDIEIDKWLKEK